MYTQQSISHQKQNIRAQNYAIALNTWKDLGLPDRIKLLSDIGRGSIHAHREFPFLESFIREDLIKKINKIGGES